MTLLSVTLRRRWACILVVRRGVLIVTMLLLLLLLSIAAPAASTVTTVMLLLVLSILVHAGRLGLSVAAGRLMLLRARRWTVLIVRHQLCCLRRHELLFLQEGTGSN
jgi:hypothetical protein